MLVLSRKCGEEVIVTCLCCGERVSVRPLAIQGSRVRLGIQASAGVRIDRLEIDVGREQRQNGQAVPHTEAEPQRS